VDTNVESWWSRTVCGSRRDLVCVNKDDDLTRSACTVAMVYRSALRGRQADTKQTNFYLRQTLALFYTLVSTYSKRSQCRMALLRSTISRVGSFQKKK
jgi:hypothetical protein